MRVVRDLFHSMQPTPIGMIYNTDLAADGSTTRYKGSLCKIMDYDDIDHGVFVTFAGLTTAMENLVGILDEDATSGGSTYLPDSANGTPITKQIIPITNSTILRAEYARSDSAGTSNVDDAIYSAASTTLTVPTMTTADTMIGGWVYWLTGNNAGYLHYVSDNGTGTSATLRTAPPNTGTAADTCLVIQPALVRRCLFDATYSGLKSEIVPGSLTHTIQGIQHYVKSVAGPMEPLNPAKHDGLYLKNASFYHDFTIPSASAGTNAIVSGQATS